MELLVTYDVDTTSASGRRRLRRVARVMEGFGLRVQYSVFEVHCDEAALARMRILIESEIDTSADTVRIYSLGTGGLRRVMSHGLPRESPTGKTWIL